ncbi:MAG: hypothetical protein V1912_09295 [bacterium]
MQPTKALLPSRTLLRPHPRQWRPGGIKTRLWLLAGIAGALIVLSLVPLWELWTVNVAGTLVNRAIVAEAAAATETAATTTAAASGGTTAVGAQSGASAAAEAADNTADAAKARADLERAMALMDAAASRGPHTAAREIPIWRTYGAAASLAPSDHAFELLLRARDGGRLDRFGELWLGEVASATEHWDVATEAYRRIDASNLLIHRAEMSLEAGDKDLAIQQYLLAKVSLEAAIDRETAEELLLDRTGTRPSATEQLLSPPAERVTSLYRIGRGLLSAGRPLEAVTVLEQALKKAKTDSPGAVIEQSLTLNLALALARTLPSAPDKQLVTLKYSYSYFPDDEVMVSVDAVVRVRALVHTGIGSSRTAPVCVQAARTLLLTGDDEQAVSLFKEAIKLDPRLAEAYLGLGGWYEGKGMIIVARELYKEGAEQLPADPQIAGAYAIASYKSLPPKNALPLLEHACQMDTRDPYLFAQLGNCFVDLGLIAQARATYEEGLRRAPDAKPLLDRLAALPHPTRSLP